MCKTSKRGNNSSEAVRGQVPNTAGGGAGGAGTGSAFPEGPAPLIGIPEFLPQVTFIATPSPNDNGFIGNAETFHRNSGLNPISITSMEQAVELLNNAPQTGSGVLNHFRIVSHFFVDDENPGFTPSNIKIAMLNSGGRGILKHHLQGWAQSNYEGLKAMVSILVVRSGTLEVNIGIYADSLSRILNALRPTHNAILDQIPTDPIEGQPTGLLKDFVTFAASKWALARFPSLISNASARADLLTAYNLLIANLKTRISTPSSANLTTMENAIVALPDNLGSVTVVSPQNVPYFAANVASGIAAFNGNFFARITTMRQRFNQFSTVDVRGCQAGNDPDYIRAVRKFFGTSETVRPAVTAPTRFQRFNGMGAITGLNTQGGIDNLHNSGIAPFNATTLRTQFDEWATGFGITQAHLDFWKTTFRLPVLEFCKLRWRSSIPARRVAISRLDSLANADFSQAITQLQDIFFFTAAQRPSTAQINAVTAIVPKLDTWTTELNATIPDSATPAQLTTHFDVLKRLYEDIDPRTAQASFTSGRIIPRTAPNPLPVAQVRTWQQNLKNFIDTDTHSIFDPIRRFMQVGHTQADAPSSKLRYFLRLGLVFQLYNGTSTNFNHQLIVAFIDGSGSNRRQNEAIRHWIRSMWRGVNPPNIPATITWDNGSNASWIVEGRTQGPSYICPNATYDQHIFKLSATAP